ncbi:hypothetical protein FB451DRAFT_1555345 [Mycena latifolia]|nr:hypothetical protein FB451DRAFT_1555345 [Mycena latifolia]
MSARTHRAPFNRHRCNRGILSHRSRVSGAHLHDRRPSSSHSTQRPDTCPLLPRTGGELFTSYPPEHEDDVDEVLLHTYASFHEEPVVALAANTLRDDTWTLCVPVPVPPTPNPTLLALTYMVKYATTGDDGNATVQTDVLLTSTALSAGVVPGAAPTGVYRASAGYAPRMVDAAAARCLATALAVKCNGGGEQWSHFLDVQHVAPNVRVRAGAQPYVVFHVAEYPTVRTARSLAVEVSATWQKEEVELKAREEAEREAREEAEAEAEEAADREAREADEKLARDEERQWREEERQARKEEARERAEAKQAREEARKWREEERQARKEREAREDEARASKPPSVEAAPPVADDKMQDLIKETMEKLNLTTCSSGYEFVKTATGYTCTGGSHHVTFEQLGMNAGPGRLRGQGELDAARGAWFSIPACWDGTRPRIAADRGRVSPRRTTTQDVAALALPTRVLVSSPLGPAHPRSWCSGADPPNDVPVDPHK